MATPRGLTPRQAEVVGLIRQGLGTKEIAQRLGVSTNAVKAHVSKLLRKFAVANRAALIEALSQDRLIEQIDLLDLSDAQRAVLDLLPVGVAFVDASGNVLVNRAAAELVGLPGRELPTRRLDEITDLFAVADAETGDRRASDEMFHRALAGEVAVSVFRVRTRAGRDILVRAKSAPKYDATGAIVGTISVFDELSSQDGKDHRPPAP